MLIDRFRGIAFPLLIAMLTTLTTVGALSLLLKTPVSKTSEIKSVYVQ